MQVVYKSDMRPDASGIGIFGWILIGIIAGAALFIAFIIWLIVLAVKRKKTTR